MESTLHETTEKPQTDNCNYEFPLHSREPKTQLKSHPYVILEGEAEALVGGLSNNALSHSHHH